MPYPGAKEDDAPYGDPPRAGLPCFEESFARSHHHDLEGFQDRPPYPLEMMVPGVIIPAGASLLMLRSAENRGFSPLDRSPVGQRGTAEDLLKDARKVIRIVVAEFRRHLFHAEGCGVQAVACRLHAQADVVLHRR